MNKIKLLAVGFSALLMASCSSDSDINDDAKLVTFYNESLQFNDEGVWENVFSPSGETPLVFGDFMFSHYGESGAYDYFYGFVPSLSENTSSYKTTAEWLEHQWSSIVGKSASQAFPYLVGYWDSYVDGEELVPENPSCSIKKTDNSTFTPVTIFVSNSSWAYYSMMNGSEMYPTPFGSSDSCELIIIGSKRGLPTGKVSVNLAKGRNILSTWTAVDLSTLGEVDMIFFQMKSTISNEYGIANPPTYFCIDGFFVE